LSSTNCPPEATLRSIWTRGGGEATLAGLEEHVEGCLECQRILEAARNGVPQTARAAPARGLPPTLPGFVIERELGRGATGVVYLAREHALDRHVAVKLFPKNSLVDPHAREHWLAEARALSRVPLDHVVAIHRVDETEEFLYLVLEYVPGGTLKQRLTEPLPPRDAARFVGTIARAVGLFHSRGLSHLDLKPSNLLLDGEPGAPWYAVSPKISDFGIARLEGEPGATETGANGPKGTPSYMAPEQVVALPGTIGPAADIHALGAILYHLLTGRPPFQGASSAETLDQVRNQDPVPPRRLNGRIPRDLETVCLTCLEKAPHRRYRTAEALADDLRLWLEGRPVKARRVSPLGHAWRLGRRHPLVAGLLLTLAVTLATGVVGLFVLLKQAEAERARLAEARRHAEAYERYSASAADQVALFLQSTIRHTRSPSRDEMAGALLTFWKSTNDLRARGIVPSSTLGIMEGELGWALKSFDKPEEAEEILHHAVVDLEQYLSKNPEARKTRYYLGDALRLSGTLADRKGRTEDAVGFYERSASALIHCELEGHTAAALTLLYKDVESHVDRLRRGGRAEQAERLLGVNGRILGHLVGSEVPRPAGGASPWPETIRRMFERDYLKKTASDEDEWVRDCHELFVYEWLTRAARPFSPPQTPPVTANIDADPEAWADSLISTLEGQRSRHGLADSVLEEVISAIPYDAAYAASLQRRLGRLDDARATAARLMAIARLFVREYPNSSSSYLLLSESYNQIKKNAFQAHDESLIEEALVRAIEAGQRALDLDPLRPRTRRRLAKLTEQLAGIKADRSAAGPSAR
jgi:tRNA A-37 threonylcarbamoyl transferase component Bud32/tetratricopeptide (TPR) repeat protein